MLSINHLGNSYPSYFKRRKILARHSSLMCPDKLRTSTLGINGTQMSRFSRIQSSTLLSPGSEICCSGAPLCSGRTKLLEAVTQKGRGKERWKYFCRAESVINVVWL